MGFVGDGSVYRVLWGFAAWEVGGDDVTVRCGLLGGFVELRVLWCACWGFT
jgi:hypothetical protein